MISRASLFFVVLLALLLPVLTFGQGTTARDSQHPNADLHMSPSGMKDLAKEEAAQREMNEAACVGLKKAEAAMRQVIGRVLSDNKDDANFVKAFNAAQDAWVAFRGAHLDALYPGPEKKATYGSVYPMCECSALEALTRDRTRQLTELWIRGTVDGDVCVGSLATHAARKRPAARPTAAKSAANSHI